MTTTKGLGKILVGASVLEQMANDFLSTISTAVIKDIFGKDPSAQTVKDLDNIWYTPWSDLGIAGMVHRTDGAAYLLVKDVRKHLPGIDREYGVFLALPCLGVSMRPCKEGADSFAEHTITQAMMTNRRHLDERTITMDLSGSGRWTEYDIEKVTYTHLDYKNGLGVRGGYDFLKDERFMDKNVTLGFGCAYLVAKFLDL